MSEIKSWSSQTGIGVVEIGPTADCCAYVAHTIGTPAYLTPQHAAEAGYHLLEIAGVSVDAELAALAWVAKLEAEIAELRKPAKPVNREAMARKLWDVYISADTYATQWDEAYSQAKEGAYAMADYVLSLQSSPAPVEMTDAALARVAELEAAQKQISELIANNGSLLAALDSQRAACNAESYKVKNLRTSYRQACEDRDALQAELDASALVARVPREYQPEGLTYDHVFDLLAQVWNHEATVRDVSNALEVLLDIKLPRIPRAALNGKFTAEQLREEAAKLEATSQPTPLNHTNQPKENQ